MISSLGTAGGTPVLAIATLGATRSANRSARTAERAFAMGLRPLLVGSREQDPPQKIGFVDRYFVKVSGGRGTADAVDDTVYLTMSLRNVGVGVAVLDGWSISTDAYPAERPDPATFTRLNRDIYVPAGDVGFWQGALRDAGAVGYAEVRRAVEQHEQLTVYLLYGDIEGAQRVISRFALQPVGEDAWLATVSRHWNLDRPDPR